MMWADYYSTGPNLPVDTTHEVIVEPNNKVYCNYLTCPYEEQFGNIEDALVAKEIHENRGDAS